MYSFDGDSLRIRKEVEQLLRQLHSVVVLAVEKGIKLEWEKAQTASDALIKRVYGSKLLNSNVFKGWNSRNNAAQEEFIKRSDRGMNLSQRVWKSCRQLRDGMEVALTVSIGEGEDAGTISRRVRQYLNDPDLMFRRFRYKVKEPMRDDKGNIVYGKDGKPKMQDKLDSEGNPIWAKKWKKRVIDHTTGKVTFIDYDKDSYHDQWTGKDYYKSAAQNAMLVARTETNIAYRRADCDRWQQLDFVLGIRVELSRNHPEVDICDDLAGDYPKDFIFDGWHPQCFCHAVPILIEPNEMLKRNEAKVRGEEYIPKGEPIKDVPQGFKDWCVENQEKILASRVRGTEPYFIKNNAKTADKIIGLSQDNSNTENNKRIVETTTWRKREAYKVPFVSLEDAEDKRAVSLIQQFDDYRDKGIFENIGSIVEFKHTERIDINKLYDTQGTVEKSVVDDMVARGVSIDEIKENGDNIYVAKCGDVYAILN